jgi:Tol biopolymer transport system component
MVEIPRTSRCISFTRNAWSRVYVLFIAILLFTTSGCSSAKSTPFDIENAEVLLEITDWPGADIIAWSPVGDKLAITGLGERKVPISKVRIFDLTTGEVHLFFDTVEFNPPIIIKSWAPDGERVVFVSEGDGNFKKGIWIVDVSGDEEPQYLGVGIDAAWSKTGELAVVRLDSKEDFITIYILDPETKEETKIFSKTGILTEGISWSPDGTKLVLGITDRSTLKTNNIYILDTTIGKLEKITTDNKNIYPEWSPFGDMIAYLKTGKVFSTHIMNSDGSCDVEILPDAPSLWNPIWSADGGYITFISHDVVYMTDLVDIFGKEFLTEGLPCP